MNRNVVVPGGVESRCLRWVALGAMALTWSVCAVAAQSVADLQSEAASAQGEVVAPSGPDEIERHGWAVLPMGEGFALVHLAPRSEVVGSDGFSAHADDGEMAVVKELSEAPERVVSSGRTVFLIFEPKGEAPMRSVLSVTAQPAPMGGRWLTDSTGRLTGRPGIDGSRAIIDAVGFRFAGGNEDRCAVLLAGAGRAGGAGGAGHSGVELLVLDGSAWVRVALPTGWEAADQARLVASERGLVLMVPERDGAGEGWQGWRGAVALGVTTFPDPTGDSDEHPFPVRSRPTVQWEGVGSWAGFSAHEGGAILEIDGSIVTSRLGPTGGWVVRALRNGAMVEVLSREVRGRAMALVATGIASGTRLVLIEKDHAREDAMPGGGEDDESDAQELRVGSSGLMVGLRLVEVSAVTGRVLYEGPAYQTPLISSNEYWLLILMAVAAVVGVLVFVLLPDPDDGVVMLPDGTALAEPMRRVAAGSADVALAMLLASWILGFAADSGLIEHVSGDLWTLLLTLVFAYVHGALGEWALGRTVGKVLLGCKVVGTRLPGSSRVGLRQALVRNLVKFVMPPIAMLGLSDANGRHRGDVLAGTVVVIRVDDGAKDADGDNGIEVEPEEVDASSSDPSSEDGVGDESGAR